jgi:aminoglycoside phosphotransferase (APT) family kinase protein
MDSLELRRRDQAALISSQRLSEILKHALPNRALGSFELLEGGASNLNYLLRFDGRKDPALLRIYTRDREACAKELAVWSLVSRYVPVPEILHANPEGFEHVGPYVIYRFAEGITFQELKRSGSVQDMAEAAFAIGAALARVHAVVPCEVELADPRSEDEYVNSPLLEQRMGVRETDRLRECLSGWMPRIHKLSEERALVHGDFNNRNTILRREGGRWVVAAILDWELAFAGSPLWDAARFLCYEQPARPCREPYFSNGYSECGGKLPKDWSGFERVLNAVSAARSLSQPEISSRFIPELRELVLGITC